MELFQPWSLNHFTTLLLIVTALFDIFIDLICCNDGDDTVMLVARHLEGCNEHVLHCKRRLCWSTQRRAASCGLWKTYSNVGRKWWNLSENRARNYAASSTGALFTSASKMKHLRNSCSENVIMTVQRLLEISTDEMCNLVTHVYTVMRTSVFLGYTNIYRDSWETWRNCIAVCGITSKYVFLDCFICCIALLNSAELTSILGRYWVNNQLVSLVAMSQLCFAISRCHLTVDFMVYCTWWH